MRFCTMKPDYMSKVSVLYIIMFDWNIRAMWCLISILFTTSGNTLVCLILFSAKNSWKLALRLNCPPGRVKYSISVNNKLFQNLMWYVHSLTYLIIKKFMVNTKKVHIFGINKVESKYGNVLIAPHHWK